ncbi:MAG: glucose 1-dehydrogenase [Dehalococcoidales bacterium]|nr:MAG: glucose 1-dehydrogenase [Dehalococcoidales bacterium]
MLFDELPLKGKTAIVTGAGRGIGKAISLAFAEAGANIVAAARTEEEIEETCREVKALGRQSLAVPTDITKADQVDRMVEETVSYFKKIDILVNNAGTAVFKAIISSDGQKMTEAEWHGVIDTNLTSIFLCCRAVAPHMFKQKKGKVINISSISSQKAQADDIPYNISKAGVDMFTRCLALDWAPYNINVNAIGPGQFHTRLSAKSHEDPKLRERMVACIPLGRVGDVREIGQLAVYLASPASDFITGQVIFIDGGCLQFSPYQVR